MNIKQHIITQQSGAGLTTTRSVKVKYILNSLRIKNSTALLSTGAIIVKEFAPIAVQNEIVAVHDVVVVNNNANFEENDQQVVAGDPVPVIETPAINNVVGL
ncbi:uncharacterized protein LOC107885685 [Acyrthosiphon pisum]|uniref:Uncharacterized protein n=1 Tax=Acyrthosiphon pisum TaxID=7029 RepID=A0A8R2H847_ACYPI|nr:uncharacterized protein LOC107885685 [Acyrthosiphon pisum]|eukprot:XP_016664846.1 PREDICTED: uncharacterized protein LOC107885685 [Acyrthosiphon pisum]